MSGTNNLFFIYAKEDSALLLKILEQLYPLKKEIGLSFWYDDPIYPDQEWYPQIVSRFEEADGYIFLLSNKFMHSSFVQQLEFKQVVDRYRDKEAVLIPILVDDCPWDVDFSSEEYTFNFKHLRVLPEPGKPLGGLGVPKRTLKQCTDEIKKMLITTFGNSPGLFDEITAQGTAERETEENTPSDTPVEKTPEAKKDKGATVPGSENVVGPSELTDLEETTTEVGQVENDGSSETEEISPVARPYREEDTPKEKLYPKKKLLYGVAALVLVVLGSIVFSQWGTSVRTKAPNGSTDATTAAPVSKSNGEAAVSSENKVTQGKQMEQSRMNGAAAQLTLGIGDSYSDGLVFEIKDDGKAGIVAHQADLGPMTWNEAMQVPETLGEGWRIPSLDELKQMYARIGQGADNAGRFADEFYWSATPFDDNQAMVVRFSDGNASFHYNSRGTHRQFLVRAVRDFILE